MTMTTTTATEKGDRPMHTAKLKDSDGLNRLTCGFRVRGCPRWSRFAQTARQEDDGVVVLELVPAETGVDYYLALA